MSSSGIIKDKTTQSQRLNVENSPHDWHRCKHRLNKALEELESTFDKMPIAHKAQYSYLCPGPQQLVTRPTQCQMIRQPMDPKSRLRAIKVFNVMLARLWRRRCAEVCDLHELVRKYQQKANVMRDDIFLRNNMINREQQRSERLELKLRQFKHVGIENCESIDNALSEARLQEEKLRLELQSKTQECNNFADMLHETKTEMFRELCKFRSCAKELAEQQRQNRLLEMQNAELEDEILTLKDRFQSQHDDIVVAVHMKQEILDEAYETLKGFEQELAGLELKHNELLRENQIDAMLQEINKVQYKMGIVRYMMCLHWPN
ncbi:uncharacterized protein LOC117793850 isoform X2 [Drosophila innubila]|nr:uncharacterized protein LOC117793850 isoform X2 [Drosophila innubila]